MVNSGVVFIAELVGALVKGKPLDCPVNRKTGGCSDIDGVNEGKDESLRLKNRSKFPPIKIRFNHGN